MDPPGTARAADTGTIEEIRGVALSDDAAVRRATAERLARLMEGDFETVFDATQEWALDPDDRLREVAALACRQSEATVDEVRARRLAGRLELFLGDRSDRVARLAGVDVLPYVLGLYPSIVSGWVRTWTPNTEEGVRADLARVLGAIAPKFPTEAIEGLAELAVDPRPRVRTAVVATLEDLSAKFPKMAPYLRERFAELLSEG
ncbi:MAG TPA: hypothetical protein VEY07_04450 [Thermoplasmata archaeon]|nr:hypothetical protein [Thermoplasmata archaeon]